MVDHPPTWTHSAIRELEDGIEVNFLSYRGLSHRDAGEVSYAHPKK
jgi:hypothetical protein